MLSIYILSAVGFVLSLYAFYIDTKIAENKNYKAVCDISDQLSCSAAAKSDYAKIGGIYNSLKGLFYYPVLALLAFFNLSFFVFLLSVATIAMTLYLLYASYFKLKNYCVVCTGIYMVNFGLLIASYLFFFH